MSSTPQPTSDGAKEANLLNDQVREIKGDNFMKKNKPRLDNLTFNNLSNINFNQLLSNQIQKTVYVPITTRGIGFQVRKIFDAAQAVKVNDVDVNLLYRISLFQVQYKLQIAFRERKATELFPAPSQETLAFDVSTGQVRDLTENFYPLCESINALGSFEGSGKMYTGFIPKPFPTMYVPVCTVRQLPAVQPFVPVPEMLYDHDHTFASITGPDPYVVALSNLRATVEALADENTNIELRRYFIARNPIPGAVFQNDLLVNVNAIIPEDYGREEILEDYDQLVNWFRALKGKYQYLIGNLNQNGNGQMSQLVSSITNARIENQRYRISTESHLAIEKMSDQLQLLGILQLCGEYPDTLFSTTVVRPPPCYALRHHTIGGNQLLGKWREVFSELTAPPTMPPR